MSDQIDPIDKQIKIESTEKINIKQLNNSLNIVNKKPSSNAVFIVPTTTDDNNTSTNQSMNTFSPLSNSNQNDDKKPASNKLTLIPLNLNTQSSPIKLATTPIKSLNETTTKTIVSPLIGSKKVIITTPNNTVQASNLIAKTDNKPLISSFNARLPTTNTKIFTISTQNSLKSVTQLPINSNTTTQPNITSINTTSVSNNLNTNPNKIQYVKIVNTANNTQQIQMHQQTIPTTVSLSSSNNSNSSINANKAIKITTISTNTNNNAITTTTTNNNNANSSQSSLSTNMDSTNSSRSLSSILSTVTPVTTVKQLNEPSNEAAMSPSSSTSALFEAINSNGQTPQTNQSLKLHTYQLVSSNNQPKITTTTKTPVIQRIQSINQYNNQPITKTIVSATTSTTSSTNQSNQINNYKVLTQQLPVSNTQQSSQFAFKSLNTTNTNNLNKISITKTISTNNTNSLDDLNRKQIITTVRNGENANNRQPITQVASSNSSSNQSFLIKNTTQPISVLTNNNSNNQHLDDNQKSTLDVFSKIFNTASPSTLASSSSTAQSHSPSKRLNLNRNSSNYDQSLASPPSSSTQANHTPGSAAVPANLSSNNRKPCNCTKSMCLKLYCDCFAMGSFCHDCNCINCFNTLEHEDERNKAIKMVLDRNPQAFQSKIGKFTAQIPLPKPVEEPMLVATAPPPNTDDLDEIQSRHIKGCNCKKSNCLKRYCECYLAKIQCSTLCKCVGCKNCDESTKTLLQLANASELLKQQQNQHQQNLLLKNSKILMSNQQHQNSLFNTVLPSSSSSMWRNNSARNDLISKHNSFNSLDLVAKNSQDQLKLEQQQNLNRSYAMLTDEAIEVTCSRLIEKVADELSRLNYDEDDENSDEEENDNLNGTKTENDSDTMKSSNDEQMETLLIEEFGRCLVQLIDTAEKRNKL